MRMLTVWTLAVLALGLAMQAGLAGELRIAAWNLEHLDDTEGQGCLDRDRDDYDALARRIVELDADIVAFQEVENAAAARRVFPAPVWHVEMSTRPSRWPGRGCWDRPDAALGHLGTGFAIRRGIAYRRNGDLKALGMADPFQRWGTDITVREGGRELRLLSVHLKTGCWGTGQDRDGRRERTCRTLRAQVNHLKAWADARREEGAAFVILGDFNRRLALPGDWAWGVLSPPAAPLRLLTQGVAFRCDPRYPAFIDHLVAGGRAGAVIVPGSFREMPRRGPHPDHCAVYADFRLGRSPG